MYRITRSGSLMSRVDKEQRVDGMPKGFQTRGTISKSVRVYMMSDMHLRFLHIAYSNDNYTKIRNARHAYYATMDATISVIVPINFDTRERPTIDPSLGVAATGATVIGAAQEAMTIRCNARS